jgi:hypothetical protein
MASEWYADAGPISIGCQTNGPRDNGLGRIKVDLWRALKNTVTSTHTPAVDHFALVMRVGGEFGDFGPELTHRVRRSKKRRYITCDIDIPAVVWQTRETDELKWYLAERVQSALRLLVSRLKHDREVVDESALNDEVSAAVAVFTSHTYASARS